MLGWRSIAWVNAFLSMICPGTSTVEPSNVCRGSGVQKCCCISISDTIATLRIRNEPILGHGLQHFFWICLSFLEDGLDSCFFFGLGCSELRTGFMCHCMLHVSMWSWMKMSVKMRSTTWKLIEPLTIATLLVFWGWILLRKRIVCQWRFRIGTSQRGFVFRSDFSKLKLYTIRFEYPFYMIHSWIPSFFCRSTTAFQRFWKKKQKFIPGPSKGCQLNPKGWLIDTRYTEPFGTQTGRSRYRLLLQDVVSNRFIWDPLIDFLRSSRHFHRHQGADHIFLFADGQGPRIWDTGSARKNQGILTIKTIPAEIKGCTWLYNKPLLNTSHNSKKLIPFMYPPKINMSPEKGPISKETWLVFQLSFFRAELFFFWGGVTTSVFPVKAVKIAKCQL